MTQEVLLGSVSSAIIGGKNTSRRRRLPHHHPAWEERGAASASDYLSHLLMLEATQWHVTSGKVASAAAVAARSGSIPGKRSLQTSLLLQAPCLPASVRCPD